MRISEWSADVCSSDLAGSADPHPRNLAAPATPGARRQRAVLVHLVASIDPENSQSIAETLLAEFHSLDRIWSRSPEALARLLGKQCPVIGLLLDRKSVE